MKIRIKNPIYGVPITYLGTHDRLQFEIVGCANHGSDNVYDLFKPTVGGVLVYKRLVIRHRLSE